MYNNVKLEKGLYNLSGKSFSQALEALDPSENYSDTPLANLDAFERQLKRFNIKVSGSDCDMVEKFFTSKLSPDLRRVVVLSTEHTIGCLATFVIFIRFLHFL